ncbi:MAG: hypothetical protein HFJ95_05870 [Muribaculaceae bacterium]|nr:hypothetical protein [Muribaculaceae bacterium]
MKIAILPLSAGVGRTQSQVDGLQDILLSDLVSSGLFSVVERFRVNDIQRELGLRNGAKLSQAQIRRLGQRLGVEGIVVGTVNFQIREKTTTDMVTGMARGEYNIDVRLISISTGEILAAAGDTQRRETERALMSRIALQLISSYQSSSASILNSNQNPITLNGYLMVYPTDLGIFTSAPISTINMINRKADFGHNSWRLPTSEEVDLLIANRGTLGMRPNITYANSYSIFRQSSPLAVRLVCTHNFVEKNPVDAGNVYLSSFGINFGNIPVLKGSVSTSFQIHNNTNTTITIISIQCSSSNVNIGNYSKTIPPYGSEQIFLSLSVKGRQDMSLTRKIIITLSNGQELTYTMQCKVV